MAVRRPTARTATPNDVTYTHPSGRIFYLSNNSMIFSELVGDSLNGLPLPKSMLYGMVKKLADEAVEKKVDKVDANFTDTFMVIRNNGVWYQIQSTNTPPSSLLLPDFRDTQLYKDLYVKHVTDKKEQGGELPKRRAVGNSKEIMFASGTIGNHGEYYEVILFNAAGEKVFSSTEDAERVDFILKTYKTIKLLPTAVYNRETKAVSLKQVNNAIHKKHPLVSLMRGNGYYYIYSDDDEIGLKLAGLFTTTIPVYRLSQQTVEQWVRDVDSLIADAWR